MKENLIFVEKVDFNDWTINDKSNENGLRLELKTSHQDAFPIIEFLFPMTKTGTVVAYSSQSPKPLRVLDLELRINHTNHFEKYFSFHTKGKISEIAVSNLKALIASDKNDKASKLLEDMMINSGQWKIVYRLSSEIEYLSGDLHDKFTTFIVDNIELFSEVSGSTPNYVEIVQSIAKKLVNEQDKNKELIISIAEKLDYIKLSWFLGVFSWGSDNDVELIRNVQKILIEKVKVIDDHPFFKNRSIVSIIMEAWKKIAPDEFCDYIYMVI